MNARQRGHELTCEDLGHLPLIVGDRSRLEQVMMNILGNAIKYMVVPGPSWGARAMTPWCRWTISRAMERPRPVPPDSRDRALSTR